MELTYTERALQRATQALNKIITAAENHEPLTRDELRGETLDAYHYACAAMESAGISENF